MSKKRSDSPAHWITPEDLLTFVELPAFSTRRDSLGLTDKDFASIQARIVIDPTGPPVIAGTGGLRKMRCGKGNVSKRDGYRVCYVYIEDYKTVLLVILYAKNELDTIPESHKPGIRQAIVRIKLRLESSPIRFGRRNG